MVVVMQNLKLSTPPPSKAQADVSSERGDVRRATSQSPQRSVEQNHAQFARSRRLATDASRGSAPSPKRGDSISRSPSVADARGMPAAAGALPVIVVGEHKVRTSPDRHNRHLFSAGDIVEFQQLQTAGVRPSSRGCDNDASPWCTGLVDCDHGNATYDIVLEDGTRHRQVAAHRLRHRVYSF